MLEKRGFERRQFVLGWFAYDVKILTLPDLTPRVPEKRWNKVRKRVLYTEITSS